MEPTWITERFADQVASPAHPHDRALGVVSELLRHPFGAAQAAESANARHDRLPDLTSARLLAGLEGRYEQGVRPYGA